MATGGIHTPPPVTGAALVCEPEAKDLAEDYLVHGEVLFVSSE